MADSMAGGWSPPRSDDQGSGATGREHQGELRTCANPSYVVLLVESPPPYSEQPHLSIALVVGRVLRQGCKLISVGLKRDSSTPPSLRLRGPFTRNEFSRPGAC